MNDREGIEVALGETAVLLPDGSGCFVASYPLPSDHWIYGDEAQSAPDPCLAREERKKVMAAARWAIKASTGNGQDMDFDPDAMAINFTYALCGPWGSCDEVIMDDAA